MDFKSNSFLLKHKAADSDFNCFKIYINDRLAFRNNIFGWLFLGWNDGTLKKYSSTDWDLVDDFGQAHEFPIISITMDQNELFLFTCDVKGVIKEWCINSKQLLKVHPNLIVDGIDLYGKNFYDREKYEDLFINVVAITPDHKHIYLVDFEGKLLKIDFETRNLLKDFGRCHGENEIINKIIVTNDSKFIITGDTNQNFKKWSTGDDSLVLEKNAGNEKNDGLVYSMNVCENSEYFLKIDQDNGYLHKWGFYKEKVLQNEVIAESVTCVSFM